MHKTPFYLLFFLLISACGRSPDREARRGLAALNAGEPLEAAAHLEAALRDRAEDTASAPLWEALGLARARAQLPGAEEALRTAAVHAEKDARIHYNLGSYLYQEGRFEEALAVLEQAADLDPEGVEALELMAEAALQLGRRGLALDALEAAGRRRPTRRVLTSLAALTPDPLRARKLLEEVLADDPTFAPAALNLAILLDRQGEEPARAIFNYERFLALSPASGLEEEIRLRVRALATAGNQRPSPTPDPALLEVQRLLSEAEAALQAGNSNQAFNLCLRAAVSAGRRNRPDLEERALRSAIRAAPEQARGPFALARFLVEQRRLPEARDALRRAESLAGQNSVALSQIAELYEQGLNDAAQARRVRLLLTE